MKRYNPTDIETKWQKKWSEDQTYAAKDFDEKPKFVMLTEFPYPSGAGLHMGHLREYTLGDIMARHQRMQGKNVLFPMGYDAFGLPTENYAIKNKISPQKATADNVASFRRTLDMMGYSIDWNRSFATSDPEYYRWTQWMFLQFFKAGLAYQDKIAINWCPFCKTGLANEEVVNGRHERCDNLVEKKTLKQWMLRITDYAERLIDGLKSVDYPSRIADQQINWIGKSTGAEIEFEIATDKNDILLIHGKDSNPEDKFYPWVKNELEEKGYKVTIPALNSKPVPVLNEWVGAIEKYNPTNNTTLIGRSRGGMAILRFLEKAPKELKVSRVILLGTNLANKKDETSGDFFTKEDYNFEKIKSHCDDFTVIHSKDDDIIPYEAGVHIAEGLNAKFISFDDKGHFGIRAIGKEFPELLELITGKDKIKVFTTRPDTIFGATFMVLAPEHPLVEKITMPKQKGEVETYIRAAQAKTEIERQETNREKTGIFTGAYATNPANGEKIPIWIADYVLMGYGTGAIMAVPAHDERDYEFAKKFNIPIKCVVAPSFGEVRESAKKVTGAITIGYNPKTDKYLAMYTAENKIRLVCGGLNDGETYDDCATRELKEETGYVASRSVRVGPWIASHFFNDVKKDYRSSLAPAYVSIIDDIENVNPERENHEEGFRNQWFSFGELRSEIEKSGANNAHWLYSMDITKKFVDNGLETSSEIEVFHDEGVVANSGEFTGLTTAEAKKKITAWLVEKGVAREKTNYKLRDWVYSRQHYWGEPIPIIHCEKCGAVPVPDNQLPVELPAVDHYEPTDTGESPLAAIESWVNTTCPTCGESAKRETDTMPNWAGSNWYYLRYFDAKNDKEFADPEKLKYWNEVDLYLGGMEHTTLHLLYSRFHHQFLYDQGLVPTPEPYAARRGQGIILAADGRKMSKSLGNVVDPVQIIESGYGADATRLTVTFLAPYDQTTPWSPEGVAGCYRFLGRVWNLAYKICESAKSDISEADTLKIQRIINKTIKKITDDIEKMQFNTAIAALMEATNNLMKIERCGAEIWRESLGKLAQLIAPFAPHIAEEIWQTLLWHKTSIHLSGWPACDEKYLIDDQMNIAVQINGKLRGEITVNSDETRENIEKLALEQENVAKFIGDKIPVKIIYVPNKIVNIVVKL